MKLCALVLVGCAAPVAAPRIPAAAAPRCPLAIDVSGDRGGDGGTGDPRPGETGGDGNDGFPGAAGPDVTVTLRSADEGAVAIIAPRGRTVHEVALDPTCPPLAIRVRGGDGGDGGDAGNGTTKGRGGRGGDGGRGGAVRECYEPGHRELLGRVAIDVRGGDGGAGGTGRDPSEPGTPGQAGPPIDIRDDCAGPRYDPGDDPRVPDVR
ncbi:MAG TPA: hypothetical protein VLX92_10790 [Kofleriaceae bacterium]|nr:hypothetical protein [Kofleriaceae bacterium]